MDARVAERSGRRQVMSERPAGMGTMGRPPPRTGSGSAPSSPAHSVDSSGTVSGTRSGGGGGGGSAVKVVVRVRPLNANERARGESDTVEVAGDKRSLSVGRGSRTFDFNACLAPDTTQPDVMVLCGIQRLLDSALHGYAASIFAYGQTGSGKTFTMSGREEIIERQDWMGGSGEDGIMTRSLAHLFAATSRAPPGVAHVVRCTYLEIYNEAIYDLLSGDNETQLQERWEPQRGFYVPGLRAVECDRLEDALAVVSMGTRNRRVGSHELNKDSSRSHSIMTVSIETHATRDGVTMSKFGKVSFIDLAGSERLKSSKSDGVMAKETANINRSLFMLGKVIAMLSDGAHSTSSTHIPYRDSKLTKLLMDSLGGSSLALMIACVSPSPEHAEETLNTLHYASRARNIINRPSVQQDPTQALIARLRNDVELLKKENGYLRGQLGMPLDFQIPGLAQMPTPGEQERGLGADGGEGLPASASGTRRAAPGGPLGFGADATGLLGAGGDEEPQRDGRRRSGPGGAGVTRRPKGRDPMDDELAGSVPLDPQFLGMNKADLASRVLRAEQLLGKYTDENHRLERENDALRGGKQLLEMEHKSALEDVAELSARLSSLEHTFLTDADGTAEAFGFEDARGAEAVSRMFPDFPTAGSATAKQNLDMGQTRTGKQGGKGGGGKPVPIENRAGWQK